MLTNISMEIAQVETEKSAEEGVHWRHKDYAQVATVNAGSLRGIARNSSSARSAEFGRERGPSSRYLDQEIED
jgi:hypothetical protein